MYVFVYFLVLMCTALCVVSLLYEKCDINKVLILITFLKVILLAQNGTCVQKRNDIKPKRSQNECYMYLLMKCKFLECICSQETV